MNFEELLYRDLIYPAFMDWPNAFDNYGNIFYTHPKNSLKQVMYALKEYNDNSVEEIYNLTCNENIAYYYGSKISRKDGPAYIKKQHNLKINVKTMNRTESEFFKIKWKSRGVLHRKKGPAVYEFEKTNLKISKLLMEWHQIPKYYFQGTLHRLNGPAVHRCFIYPEIKYYIYGKRYGEYDYWMYMLKNHPNKLPKIISKTNKKITFETNLKKPAPKVIYKKIKKLTYQYNCENMNGLKYWTILDNYYLLNRENWLILK